MHLVVYSTQIHRVNFKTKVLFVQMVHHVISYVMNKIVVEDQQYIVHSMRNALSFVKQNILLKNLFFFMSCATSTVNCPQNNQCNVVCSSPFGNGEPCRDININWPTNISYINLTLNLNFEGFGQYGVQYPPKPLLDPYTDYELTCYSPEFGSCRGMYVNCPEFAHCTINCPYTVNQLCQSAVINYRNSQGNLTVNCGGSTSNSCFLATVNCPENGTCDITCDGQWSCGTALFNWDDHPGLGNLVCNSGSYACYGVEFPIPDPNQQYSLLCDASNMCSGTKIFCPVNANCDIQCTSGTSCQTATIICPETANCSVSCQGSSACQDVTIWSIDTVNVSCANDACTGLTQGPPTESPTNNPTSDPSKSPTQYPSKTPTKNPSKTPSSAPTFPPTFITTDPSRLPTLPPSKYPTPLPTICYNDDSKMIESNDQIMIDDFRDNRMNKSISDTVIYENIAYTEISFTKTNDENTCIIECLAYESCIESKVTIQETQLSEVIIDCNTTLSCAELSLTISNSNIDSVSILCASEQSCDNMAIRIMSLSQLLELNIICVAGNACDNLFISGDS
eukprot:306123_1